MSEISVNEHLEGILSDFEALKRSFDVEDADDVPPFSLPSSLSAPVSPLPSHSFLNRNNPGEGRDRSSLSPSLAFNNNNNNSLGPAAHHSHISSSPRPVLKTRNLSSSLSFNRGTAIKPAIHNNGSSVIRASSFQSRFNPNGFSLLSGPGSDNDSLHSSTSSLEYSGGVGASLTLSKLGLYPSVSPQEEFHLPQFPQQAPEENENFGHKLHLKKFSSHGNVFHSEMDQGSGIRLGAPGPRGSNHCSMPSLDLQIRDMEGGKACTHGGRGGDQMSPGLRQSNANWNGRHGNAAAYGEEGYGGTRHYHQQNVPHVLKVPQLKVKETLRLNKFPLDLDALVSGTSANQVQGGSMSPHQPKPPPRSGVDPLYHPNPLSTSVSSSASLSSMESSSDALASSFQHSYVSVSPRSPTPSQDPIAGPPACSPVALSTDHGPHTEISHGHHEVANQSGSYVLPSDRSIYPLRDTEGEAGDSVGSILQRIASFSLHTTPVAIPVGAQHQRAQSNAGSLSPPVIKPRWRREVKKQKEASGKAETGPPVPMEDTQKEKCIMGQVQDDDGTTQEQPPNANDQGSVAAKEGLGAEIMEERGTEKGMDEGELQKEVQLEAELKMELWGPEQDLQLNYVHGSDLVGYVGIEAVLDQMRNKTMKVGFDFNIMVVGQSGLGKSTLVNTLFKSKVSRKSCMPDYEEKISKTVKLHTISHVIEEKGVKMKLTVVDTPGFGDQINNENCWEPIVTYVNEQYEKYLREELYVTRKRRIPDSRIHCCIYFLPATGHRLRSIDIEFMKRLGRIVSIVPVIAKADALTIEERQEFKERIRQDLAANGICVYPQKEYDEDPQERIINDRIRESIPFAVVGTDKEHQVNGNKVLGRKTKWGIIEVENMEHCEFAYLRDLLIRSHLQDLKDVTHNIHYETYRMRRLNESNVNFTEVGLSTWLLEGGTAERSESNGHL